MNNFLSKIKTFFKTNSQIIRPTAVLTIICLVVTLALSSANMITYKKIDALETENQEKSMAKVMPGEYEEVTQKLGDDEVTYHIVKRDNEIIGYIFVTSEKGYGGDISVMTAVDTTAAIVSIEILDASGETPGLGQNITDEKFYNQFKGTSGTIDAVTGATISSEAVTKAVNTALEYAAEILETENDIDVITEEILPEGDALE